MSRSEALDLALTFRSQIEEATVLACPWPGVPEPRSSGARALYERLEDLFRPEPMARSYERAAAAPPGPVGESDRRRLRVLAGPALARAATAADAELHRVASGVNPPEFGFRSAMARSTDPARRKDLLDSWIRAEASLEPLRRQRRDARALAARAFGARGVLDLLAATHPVPVRATLAEFTRDAIAPLDELTRGAARARRARFVPALPAESTAADDPPQAALADHRASVLGVPARAVIAELASALGFRWGSSGPEVRRGAARLRGCAALEESIHRPAIIVPDEINGAESLLSALAAWGRAARAALVRRARGVEAVAGADPAHAVAAELLFRRLPLTERFREHVGWTATPAEVADLRFESAVVLRLEWADLAAACEEPPERPHYGADLFLRAVGRAVPPDRPERAAECDPKGAASLRGAWFALAIEERLLTRFGRDWFRQGGAGGVLSEIWEADCDETVESLSAALGLGTMEASWLADACRP